MPYISIRIRLIAVNDIKRDVFETLYLKRPSKSRSSKSSSESFRGVEDMPANNVEKSQFNGNTYRKSKHSQLSNFKEEEPAPSETKSESKLKKYLFGSTEKPSSVEKNGDENKKSVPIDDPFKTVTINSLRRSFRDSFLQSSKPKKDRQHQPLWFIDVTKDKEPTPQPAPKPTPRYSKAEDSDNLYENTKPEKKVSSISRKETFRVDEKPNKYSNSSLDRKQTFRVDTKPDKYSGSLGRKETFRIDDSSLERRRKAYEPVRVEIISPKADRNKVVPIAITAPYSALNDVQERARRTNGYSASNDEPSRGSYSPDRSPVRRNTAQTPSTTSYAPNRDSFRGDTEYQRPKPTLFSSTNFDAGDEFSHDNQNDYAPPPTHARFSHIRNLDSIKLPNDYAPGVNRTVVTVGAPTDHSQRYAAPYRDASPTRDPYYSSFRSQNDDFDRRYDAFSRRSLKDTRSIPDDTYRSPLKVGSFRSMFERKPSDDYRSTHRSLFRNTDEIDHGRYDVTDEPQRKPQTQSYQSWRNISTRPFTTRDDVDPNYRSFVPYHNYDKTNYPAADDRPSRKDNNRTTININYNYNSPPTTGGSYSSSYRTRNDPSPIRSRNDPSPIRSRNDPSPIRSRNDPSPIRSRNDPSPVRSRNDPSPTRRAPSALTSMPSLKSSRDKSNGNKNRSVNFPSVEYEVRLISPNYETTSRRRTRPSATASNADWTFNKVHV